MRRLAVAALIALVGVAPSARETPIPQPPPRKLALLVGIDEYQAVNQLHGSVNDVERMKALLVGRFGFLEPDVIVLTNQRATRAGITRAVEALIARAAAGDVVLFHFSGHGSRMLDDSGDEVDGWDETIVPQDSRQQGIFDISDDELNVWLTKLTAKTPFVTVVLDSCHSGSATRGGAEVRLVPDDRRPPPPAPAGAARPADAASGVRPPDAQYVLITAARPHELANEDDFEGVRNGALTYFLTRAMAAAPPGVTYRDLIEAVRTQVTAIYPSQHPETEGPIDRVVFGDVETRAEPYVLVDPAPAGRGATLHVGSIYGLTVDSALDVYPPQTRSFGPPATPTARITVTDVRSTSADARIDSGGAIAPASRAVLRTTRYPESKLRVFFNVQDAAARQRIDAALAGYSFFTRAASDGAADLVIRQSADVLLTESADRIEISPRLKTDDPEIEKTIVERLKGWAKWFAIVRLSNPSGRLPVELTIGDGRQPLVLKSGDKVDVKVENLSSQNVYITVLDLAPDGSITLLYPTTGTAEHVPPGRSASQKVEFSTLPGRSSVTDVIKAIVATDPIEPSVFTQAAPRAADARPTAADPLTQFMQSAIQGRARPAAPVTVTNWTTFERRVVTTSEPAPQTPTAAEPASIRLASFVLHFDEAAGPAPGQRARGTLPLCPASGSQPDSCWALAPLGPGTNAVEAKPQGRRDGSRAPATLADAWNQAYELRRTTGAEFVEPIFEVDLRQAEPEPGAGRSTGGGTPDKPGAAADAEWSLKHIAVDRAWSILRQPASGGAPAGAEGRGVTIAHLDTGYREHPEYWTADEARSPVMFKHGYDYLDDDNRPFDELDTSGALPNPGHGTKSGSVIVSPPGKQWTSPRPNEYVTGVAPGARLVPLRIHRSVVHLNSGTMAKAMLDAAAASGHLSTPVDIISISMGGLPSLALYKAARAAERNGVIVVAAAGNEVGFVVWPARFEETIAVAATNVECGTWPGSSHGTAVDIAAPGESVWHATVSPDGTNGVAMGQGTTFATATTAGVAALWVARNKSSPAFAQLKASGGLTKAFRDTLQRTSWQPGTAGVPAGVACATGAGWNPSEYGTGIVNAGAAIAAPLVAPAPTATRAAPVDRRFPLFASLFPPATDEAVVQERYRALLPNVDAAELSIVEGEVVNLYALNASIRAALDRIASTAPDLAAYAAARRALGAADLSSRLRTALDRGNR